MLSQNAATFAQFQVRYRQTIPLDLAKQSNAIVVNDLLAKAWDNDWRDPTWLATCALEGTEHPNVQQPAALYVSQLRRAAENPCPIVATPTPPSVRTRDEHYSGPPASDGTRAAALAEMRAGINEARRKPTSEPERTNA